MAIALDASSKSGTSWNNGTSMTWSHTVAAGSDLYLVVGITCGSQGDNCSGVTYNSVAMTLLKKDATAGNSVCYIFGLANPATGAHNIVASFSPSESAGWGAAESLSGVKQTSQPDASNSGISGSSPNTVAVTTVADNSWLFGMSQGRTPLGAGTATTFRQDGTNGTDAGVFDSNGVKTPPGSFSLSVTSTSGGNNVLVVVSIAPPSAAGTDSKFLALF